MQKCHKVGRVTDSEVKCRIESNERDALPCMILFDFRLPYLHRFFQKTFLICSTNSIFILQVYVLVSLRKLHYIRFAVSYERRGQPAIYQAVKLSQRQGSTLIEYPSEAIPLSLHLGVLNCSSIFNKLYCDILLLRVCEIC